MAIRAPDGANKNNPEIHFVSQIEDQSHRRMCAESEGEGVRDSLARHSSHTRSKSVHPAG